MTKIGVKRLRVRAKLSQQAFAKALGVSFASVNRWEGGGVISQMGQSVLRLFEARLAFRANENGKVIESK